MISVKNAAFALLLGASVGCAGNAPIAKQGVYVAWLQDDAKQVADSLAKIGLPMKDIPEVRIGNDNDAFFSNGNGASGVYFHEDGYVMLRQNDKFKPVSYFPPGLTSEGLEYLIHELAHQSIEERRRELGLVRPTNGLVDVGAVLVSEGVADCAVHYMLGKRPIFNKWINDFGFVMALSCIPELKYYYGAQLVWPSFQQDPSRAMDIFLENPPSIGDFESLPYYQLRINELMWNPHKK